MAQSKLKPQIEDRSETVLEREVLAKLRQANLMASISSSHRTSGTISSTATTSQPAK